MNILATRLNNIKASPTLAVTAKIAQLKSLGISIIDFGAGEPSFPTPDYICKAAIKAIDSGYTKYTAIDGTASLKNAIINKFKNENNLTYSIKQITVGCGAKQVLFNAFMATLNKGDEVIIPAPYWVSYPDMVQVAEGIPVIIPCEQKDNFKLTPDALRKAITPKTKWLILNSPSNPTGMVYSEEELRSLIVVLKENPHVWIMSDDIYEHLVYDELSFINILNIDSSLYDRSLIINGVSKSFAMTGWRIGYAAGPETLINCIGKIQSHSTSNPCSISQYAAEAALNTPMDFLPEWKKQYIKRRELAFNILSESSDLKIIKPNGAFYIFVNCEGLIGKIRPNEQIIENDTDVCDYLLEEAKVGVVMGTAFGLSPYFRMSYVADDKIVEQGCNQIIEALGKLK